MDTKTRGNFIRETRESKGWSQETLAGHVGVSRRTISDWENDKVVIKAGYKKKLADVLELEVCELELGHRMEVLDKQTKAELNAKIVELYSQIESVDHETIANEETGIEAKDLSLLALFIAYLALGIALDARYPDSRLFSILVIVALLLGPTIYLLGKLSLKERRNHLNKRKGK